MRKIILSLLCITALSLGVSCAEPTDSPDEVALGPGMHLALSTRDGDIEYRLTRGTFTIVGNDSNGEPSVKVVNVDPENPARTLVVPVEQGSYQVRLEDGWELSVSYGGPFVPVLATLPYNPIEATVYSDWAQLVTFDFELGNSQLALGISVWGQTSNPPLAVPEGHDGVLVQQSDGTYAVYLPGLGHQCCWETVADAREAFSGYRLYDPAE